jgi:hypothetical protein
LPANDAAIDIEEPDLLAGDLAAVDGKPPAP